MQHLTQFMVLTLAVWRVTHLLNAEDGPGDILVKFRNWVGDSFIGTILDCFLCLSVWVAIPFTFLMRPLDVRNLLVVWLALSGGASILHLFIARGGK